MEAKNIKEELKFLRYFFSYLLTQKNLVILSVIFLVGGILSEISIPLLIRKGADKVIDTKRFELLLIYSGAVLLAIIISSINHYFLIYFTNKVGQNIIYDIRKQLFSHIIRLPMSFFDKTQSGKLVIRLTNDVENLSELFVSGLITFTADILIIAGIITVLFILNLKLALVSIAVFPIMIIVVILFRKKASRIYLEIRRRISELNSFISESILGIKTIKILPAYSFAIRNFETLNRKYSEEVEKSIILFALFFSSIIFISSISLGSVMWFGGLKILEREIGFGTFLAFWYAVNKLFDPIWDFSEKYNIVQSAIAAAKRIREIFSTPKEYEDRKTQKPKPKIEKGEIEFKDVWFSYDGKKTVISNVSFKINSGEKVAIVGLTGAGKTTIANLLTRVYKPQKGKILIDGKDIDEYELSELRKSISLIHQDVFIFSRKVKENITLGEDDDEKMKKIMKILEQIGIELDIEKEIGEDGAGLSSGEKQIIATLRALYFDPKIIIFDEATAFVDPNTEKKINKLIDELFQGKTIIKIAHRPETIKTTQRIILIKKGKVQELSPKEIKNIELIYQI
ncbi:putative ABC transporter ATP-binding protein [bacterium HR19]|nr:putative ABC transporter ATP-binding protein [bacterium HR19]